MAIQSNSTFWTPIIKMKNKAIFKPLQPLFALNSIYISTIKNINKWREKSIIYILAKNR